MVNCPECGGLLKSQQFERMGTALVDRMVCDDCDAEYIRVSSKQDIYIRL